MGELRGARQEIVDVLTANGVRAYPYNSVNIIPPIVLVLPNPVTYIRSSAANQTMNSWPVGITLLIVGGNTDEPATLDALDDYLEKTLVTLSQSALGVRLSDASPPGWADLKFGRAIACQVDCEVLVSYDTSLG